MKRTNKYPITNFYVGELYLYKKFGNIINGENIEDGENRIKKFSDSGAVYFQQDLISRYIDWENKREYVGFLTLFYKQNGKYICLHDGKIYELNNPNIVDNLVLLKDLLPKIDTKSIPRISMYEALELFDVLFKNDIEKQLYIGAKQKVSDFYIGDIALEERKIIENPDVRIQYTNLPHHLMLGKSNLEMYSFGKDNSFNTVYRCLFLRDGVDLYNVNNHQFYNPNEEHFDSIISFKDYMTDFEIKTPSESITIPKALRLFKRTI